MVRFFNAFNRFHSTFAVLAGACQMFLSSPAFARLQPDTEHVATRDLAVVDDAFLQGYTHNEVTDVIQGQDYPSLAIGCVGTYGYRPHDEGPTNQALSIWTRDLPRAQGIVAF